MSKTNNNTKKISFGRNGEYSNVDVQFSTGLVKLSRFYNVTSNAKKYLIAFVVGIFMGIATLLLVEITGLYSGGTAALFQGIARLFYVLIVDNVQNTGAIWIGFVYNIMFWGMYLLFNLVLFSVLFKKLNRQCIIISCIYLITTQIVGFALSSIPNIHNFMIFGSTATVNLNLRTYNVQCIIYNPNVWPTAKPLLGGQGYYYDWSELIIDPNQVADSVKTDILNQNITSSFLLILYAVIYAIVTAVSNAVLYIIGGSSAGTELISLYLSEEKNRDISTFLKIFQSSCMFIGSVLGCYVSGIIINLRYYSGWQYFFNANLVASFIWVLVNTVFVAKLFPSRKLVRIEVFAQDARALANSLKQYNYTHPTTVVDSIGGYSGNKNSILITVIPLFEVSTFVQVIRLIDKRCLISTLAVDDCDGRITLQKHKSIAPNKIVRSSFNSNENTIK
ncbi:MAG: YitT family protein [Mycoplasma sp.]|nr:YitT family protein [Mycoplasma sp.]